MFLRALPRSIEGMTTHNTPHVPPSPTASQKTRLNWPIILGLGVLALLWPLTGILGFDGPGRAVLVLVTTLGAWIGVVGFGRVPRPVLTLTLTGLAYGVFYLVAIAIVVTPLAFFAWYTVAATAGLGALAGLAALGVQKVLAR